jgi:tRNA 5-methylaminomethyl-2-thiouridine biosynthesis bifunctional protein
MRRPPAARVLHGSAALRVDGEWQVRDAAGALIAQAPTAILASGAAASNIEQAAELPLFKLRGQVTHLPLDVAPPQLPLVVCREAYVTPPSNGIVCAGATYDNDDDPRLRASSQQENLTRLAEIIPGDDVAALATARRWPAASASAAPRRTACRWPALPDYPNTGRARIPARYAAPPGPACLLGYASRGLIWAPLMAELLVSQLEHTPPPLEAALVDALDPAASCSNNAAAANKRYNRYSTTIPRESQQWMNKKRRRTRAHRSCSCFWRPPCTT